MKRDSHFLAASSEMELLLCCVHRQSRTVLAEQIHQLIQNINWDIFIQHAIDHNVVPLVYAKLSESCPDLIPEHVLVWLQREAQSNAFRALRLTAELFKILDILEDHGISAVPFKGPILAVTAYGNLHLRTFVDIDIWLKWEDYLKPKSLLASCGYESPIYHFQEEKYHQFFGEYSMTRDNGSICVDIHGKLVSIDSFALACDFSVFWSRLEPTLIAGRKVLSFQLEDLLLYLCVNGIRDCWASLQAICDIAELIQNHPELNWQRLTQEADRLGITRILNLGLLLAYQLLDSSLPPQVYNAAIADSQARWLAKQVCDRIRDNTITSKRSPALGKFIFRILAMERLQDKLLYSLKIPYRAVIALFTLNSRDYSFVHLPDSLYYLYYLIRPIRVFREHGFKVLKMFFP